MAKATASSLDDSPCHIDEAPIFDSSDRHIRRLYKAYGFDEEGGVPQFLWRENIDCVAQGCIQPERPEYPRWGACNLPISCTVYERIRPALTRVGAMMAMSESFFAKVLFADIESFADPALHGSTYLDPSHKKPTEEERAILARTIRGLRSSLRFFMGLEKKHICHHGRASGRLDTTGSSIFYRLEVSLSPTYLRFISNPYYHLLDDETKNTVLFSRAATILREMAHTFWQIRQAWAGIKYIQDLARSGVNSPWRSQPEPLVEIGVPRRELGRAWESFFFGGFPEMRGKIDDPKAENPLVWVNGTQLPGWQTLLGVDLGPEILERPIDSAVQAFFDDEIFDRVLIVLDNRRKATGDQLESLTFDEALDMAKRIVFEEQEQTCSARLEGIDVEE